MTIGFSIAERGAPTALSSSQGVPAPRARSPGGAVTTPLGAALHPAASDTDARTRSLRWLSAAAGLSTCQGSGIETSVRHAVVAAVAVQQCAQGA